MGQKHTDMAIQYNRKDIKQAIERIFEHPTMVYSQKKVVKQIRVLIKQLQSLPPFTTTQQGLHINKLILHIFVCRNYEQCLFKMLKLLIDSINQILQIQSIFLVHPAAWKSIRNIVKFIAILSDEVMWKTLNGMFDLQKLDTETKNIINRIKYHRFSLIQPLIDKLLIGQVNKVQEVITNLLNEIIQFQMGILTRSQQTYQIMRQFQQVSFVLYLKLYFSSHHNSFKYQILNSYSKYLQCLRMATYFLLIGINDDKPSLFNLSVLYLKSVMDKRHYSIENCILPSYLFPNIPSCSAIEFYSYIIFHLLYVMIHKSISSFSYDSVLSFQLLLNLINSSYSCHQQIQPMLEKLCLNTDPCKVQRAYLLKIVQIYLVKKSKNSKILQSYTDISNTYYNLKGSNLKQPIDINNETVIAALKTNATTLKVKHQNYTQKYLYQQIFKVSSLAIDVSPWKKIIEYRLNNLIKQETKQQSQNLSTDYLSNNFKTMDQIQNHY